MKATTRKKVLLASAAAAVMGLGMTTATPAKAFDYLHWQWDKLILEDVVKTANILIDIAPSGMFELEKIQAQIGDVTADSTVSNITNNPPGEDGAQGGPEPGPQIITVDFLAEYEGHDYGHYGYNYDWTKDITSLELKEGTTEGVELADGFEGTVDKKDKEIWLTFDLTVPVEPTNGEAGPQPIPIGERDAMDLPKVESVATAVGNLQNLESSVSMQLHDAQYLFGGFTDAEDMTALEDLFTFSPESGNTHTEVAGALTLAGALGLIDPASITATSSVNTILNATVDSDATAIGNSMSIELAAFTPDDAALIGDATQFSYADILATSMVSDVTLEGYTGLGAAGFGPCGGCIEGEPQIPVVSSVATAIGNNFSATVSSPEL